MGHLISSMPQKSAIQKFLKIVHNAFMVCWSQCIHDLQRRLFKFIAKNQYPKVTPNKNKSNVHIVRIWLKFYKIWPIIWPISPKNLTKIWPIFDLFWQKSYQNIFVYSDQNLTKFRPFLAKIWQRYICVFYRLYDLFVSMNLLYIFQKLLNNLKTWNS